DLAIAAAVVHERCAFADADAFHLADEDGVIAAGKLAGDAAFERSDGAVEQRHAEVAAGDRHVGELVLDARGEAVREIGLRGAEDAHAELAGGDDRFVRLHGFFDADEDERRTEREGRERRHGHAVRAALVLGRHHGHAAREVGHGELELRVINGHARELYKLFARAGVLGAGGTDMRRLALVSILLLTVAGSASAAISNTIRKGFNVADGGTLTIDASVGDIQVVSGGTGVAVEVVRDAQTSSQSKADKVFRDFDVAISQNGNDVAVRIPHQLNDWHFFDFGNPIDIKVNVRVPSRYNVDLKTSGGN